MDQGMIEIRQSTEEGSVRIVVVTAAGEASISLDAASMTAIRESLNKLLSEPSWTPAITCFQAHLEPSNPLIFIDPIFSKVGLLRVSSWAYSAGSH